MAPALARGFEQPVIEAQVAFRAAMDAFARPGTHIPFRATLDADAPLPVNAAALGLALLDFEVAFHLAPSLAGGGAADYIRFHTGARETPDPGKAAFAILDLERDALHLAGYAQGLPEYPDRSTTLIALCREAGSGLAITGPGIKGAGRLGVAPLPPDFAAQWAANRAGFPLGVDLLFVTGAGLIGLPRATRLVGDT